MTMTGRVGDRNGRGQERSGQEESGTGRVRDRNGRTGTVGDRNGQGQEESGRGRFGDMKSWEQEE